MVMATVLSTEIHLVVQPGHIFNDVTGVTGCFGTYITLVRVTQPGVIRPQLVSR